MVVVRSSSGFVASSAHGSACHPVPVSHLLPLHDLARSIAIPGVELPTPTGSVVATRPGGRRLTWQDAPLPLEKEVAASWTGRISSACPSGTPCSTAGSVIPPSMSCRPLPRATHLDEFRTTAPPPQAKPPIARRDPPAGPLRCRRALVVRPGGTLLALLQHCLLLDHLIH